MKRYFTEEAKETTVPVHPLRVKPLGNAYTSNQNIKTTAGLFALLPDELITQVIEWCEPTCLLHLGSTCKTLYAFCRQEDLWKTLLLRSAPTDIEWQGSWLSTYLGVPKEQLSHLACENLFSDALHRPFLCAHSSLLSYTTNVPSANAIPRFCNLTAGDFESNWADKPFILTEPILLWPVSQRWSTDALLEKYGDTVFQAEAVDWPLRTYMEYMSNNEDESPLYLFDSSFVEKMNLKVGSVGDYWPPECFGKDLFDVLGDQRPDRRWLIVGGAGSGSSYHKDPNATSAWNAVLRGSKYWIMFPSGPSHRAPPGVYVSKDQSEVTSPLSITEWLLNFHAEARKTPGCMEGICNEGEVLHVPSKWWHLVINLSPSIAITQNFIPEAHLANALGFLRDRPQQVSGFGNDVEDPYSLFTARLRKTYPALFEKGLSELERLELGKKRKWDELVGVNGEEGARGKDFGFGFGLGDDDDAEVP